VSGGRKKSMKENCNMIRPLQTKTFPSIGSQQAAALPMQSSTLPAQTNGVGIDISELMNLMITMMIVMMMMKMMGGMMGRVA